jgi:hypothetical protein
MSKYRNYTESDIKKAVLQSKSIANVLRILDLKPVGGNYETIKRKINELDLDTSHFIGQAWIAKGTAIKKFDDITKPETIKKRLINERGYKCENCNLSVWLNKPICLELEHISGDRSNNTRENLKLLCPNCHAQTPTWRRRKKMTWD